MIVLDVPGDLTYEELRDEYLRRGYSRECAEVYAAICTDPSGYFPDD